MAQLHFTYRQIADIVNMYTKEGHTLDYIGTKYKCSYQTINTIVKNHKESIRSLERITKNIAADSEETIARNIAA